MPSFKVWYLNLYDSFFTSIAEEEQGVFEGTDAKGGKFLAFDSTLVTEELCTNLCSEMPKCTSLTFRGLAEEDKHGKTKPGQCRFKNGRTRKNLLADKPGRISFFKNEDGSYEKFIDQGIGQGKFLAFDSQDATEEACAKLCKEMPRCVGSTLWVTAEGSTEAPQCRFSTA